MSRTPERTSGDVNVRVASHLSKVPAIATDASTSKLILLPSGVILNTGIAWVSCGRVTEDPFSLAATLGAGFLPSFGASHAALAKRNPLSISAAVAFIVIICPLEPQWF